MKQKKQKKSKMLDAIREMAQGLYEAGVINDETMREFNALLRQTDKKLAEDSKPL